MSLLTAVGVAILFSHKHGYPPAQMLFAWSSIAITMIFTPIGIVTRLRSDGSMSFMGALPIGARQHFAAWLATLALCAAPAAIGFFILIASTEPRIAGVALPKLWLVVGEISAIALFIAIICTFLAVQLRSAPGSNKIAVAMLALTAVTPVAYDYIRSSESIRQILSLSPSKLVATVLCLSWALTLPLLAWSSRSIGKSMAFSAANSTEH